MIVGELGAGDPGGYQPKECPLRSAGLQGNGLHHLVVLHSLPFAGPLVQNSTNGPSGSTSPTRSSGRLYTPTGTGITALGAAPLPQFSHLSRPSGDIGRDVPSTVPMFRSVPRL